MVVNQVIYCNLRTYLLLVIYRYFIGSLGLDG